MTSQQHERSRHSLEVSKQLVPTVSVDKVLLTGSTGGKGLTLFQSVGLMIAGLGIALGVGAMIIAGEIHLEATFDRDYGQLFVGGAFLLWGLAMLLFGLVGIFKIIARKRRTIS